MLPSSITLLLPLLAPLAAAYKGDMTHYTPGLGSCGIFTDPSKQEPVVALAREMMGNGPNPNTNPKCGTKIRIQSTVSKKTHLATIVDTCWACKKEDIDVNEKLFYQVAPKGDGRVHNVVWGGQAVGRLGMEDEVEEAGWVEEGLEEAVGVAEGEQGEPVGLVEQLGGSMRFRKEKDTFMQGCGKVVSKIRDTTRRFW